MKFIIKIAFLGIVLAVAYKEIFVYLNRPRRFTLITKHGDYIKITTPVPHNLTSGKRLEFLQDYPPPFGTDCYKKIIVPNVDGVRQVNQVIDQYSFTIGSKWPLFPFSCIDGSKGVWTGWYAKSKANVTPEIYKRGTL